MCEEVINFMILDFIDDNLDITAVIFFILIVIGICFALENGIEKCEKNGGVVIKNGRGYTCLTKEDMAKLRGEK